MRFAPSPRRCATACLKANHENRACFRPCRVRIQGANQAASRTAGTRGARFWRSQHGTVDYPDFIRPAAQAVAAALCERGIVLGGSGNGEAIVANKVKGVRCALCWNAESARLARAHNDANIISLGQRMIPGRRRGDRAAMAFHSLRRVAGTKSGFAPSRPRRILKPSELPRPASSRPQPKGRPFSAGVPYSSSPPPPELGSPTPSINLISGRKSAMTMLPTMIARKTIMIGSRREVIAATALSTSSS